MFGIDTVGELRSAEVCMSYMPSLKAKKLGKRTQEKSSWKVEVGSPTVAYALRLTTTPENRELFSGEYHPRSQERPALTSNGQTW